MKNVFLYAYDRQNLGDDLFIHTITRRYPDVQFYIWSDRKNRETFASLPNLKLIDKDSRFIRLLQKLRSSLVVRYKSWLQKRCDAVVYIGGSIFMEYPTWVQICSWWGYEAANYPLYVLGANFGPYHTEAYREKMAAIFRSCRDVCFRDGYSHGLFRDVSTVRQTPDILLSYPMPQVPVKEKQIFVSVINCAGRDESHDLKDCDEGYVANMANLLSRYLNDGYKLVLASFCKEEGDELGIEKILRAMGCIGHPGVRVLCYNGTNADQLIKAIAESGSVIATRFHGTILALAAGWPVLPILYSDKTRHVLEDLSFEGIMLDLRDASQWDLATCIRSLDWQKPIPMEISASAQNNFSKLDQMLKSGI